MRLVEMIKTEHLCQLCIAGLLLLSPLLSQAGVNNWGYVYAADTLPKGQSELYLWATDRRHKESGKYNAQDYQLELEHGFTDSVQGSARRLAAHTAFEALHL